MEKKEANGKMIKHKQTHGRGGGGPKLLEPLPEGKPIGSSSNRTGEWIARKRPRKRREGLWDFHVAGWLGAPSNYRKKPLVAVLFEA